MLIETTLSKAYQEGTWTVIHAIRELVSNAIDGETKFSHLGRGKMDLTYRNRTLYIRNEMVEVPAKALLMGVSESRADDRMIGQFGEGLPLALLVLARENYGVEIFNGKEKWTPQIVRSTKFNGEPILAVNVRQLKVDRQAFEVQVFGVAEETWEEVQRLFLKLDPAFDQSKALKGGNDKQVLLQPEFKGRIYSKGVFIHHSKEARFGYDITGVTLNRDRSFIDRSTLSASLNGVLGEVVKVNATFCLDLARTVVADASAIEGGQSYSELYYVPSFSDAVHAEFVAVHGTNSFPYTEEDWDKSSVIKNILAVGMTPVALSPLAVRCITSKMPSISSLLEDQKQKVQEEHTAFRVDEAVVLAQTRTAFWPELDGMKLRIVSFHDNVVSFVAGDASIDFNRRNLANVTDAFREMAMAIAQAKSMRALDVMAVAFARVMNPDIATALTLTSLEAETMVNR